MRDCFSGGDQFNAIFLPSFIGIFSPAGDRDPKPCDRYIRVSAKFSGSFIGPFLGHKRFFNTMSKFIDRWTLFYFRYGSGGSGVGGQKKKREKEKWNELKVCMVYNIDAKYH